MTLRAAVLAAGAVAVTAVLLTGCRGGDAVPTPNPRPDPRPASTAGPWAVPAVPAGPVGPESRAAAVLRSWDRRRAAAWSRGSVPALRRLYVAGAGSVDVGLLRSYRARGLRVERMRTQVLALRVVDREPQEWTLRVTDRLQRAVVVGAQGRRVLPRDQADVRLVTLERVAGRWRVAAVGLSGPGPPR